MFEQVKNLWTKNKGGGVPSVPEIVLLRIGEPAATLIELLKEADKWTLEEVYFERGYTTKYAASRGELKIEFWKGMACHTPEVVGEDWMNRVEYGAVAAALRGLLDYRDSVYEASRKQEVERLVKEIKNV